MTADVWWVGHLVSGSRVAWHSADYDPRRDVDKLRPLAETTCGRSLNPRRLVAQPVPVIGDRVCRTCYRLTHDADQGSMTVDVDRNALLPV